MRYIIVFLITMLFLTSCEKEESVIFDLNISPDEISRIELRGDHKTLAVSYTHLTLPTTPYV